MFAVFFLAAQLLASAAAAETLLPLGAGAFAVDVGNTTATYQQRADGLLFSAVNLGDTLPGTFSSRDWNKPNYQQFGLLMSISGANPGVPFQVEIFDASLTKVVALLEGTTIGVGSAPVFVSLNFILGSRASLTKVGGLQITWNGVGVRGALVTAFAAGAADTTRPVVGVTAPAGAKSNTKANEFTLRGTVTDNISPSSLRLQIKKPGQAAYGPWLNVPMVGGGASKTWTQLVQLPAEGVWSVRLQAADAAGNKSSYRVVTLVADRTAPIVSLTVPSSGSATTTQTSFSLQGAVADNVAPTRLQFQVKPPGAKTAFGKWQAGSLSGIGLNKTWACNVPLSSTGQWSVRVRAIDAAGNASAPQSATITRK